MSGKGSIRVKASQCSEALLEDRRLRVDPSAARTASHTDARSGNVVCVHSRPTFKEVQGRSGADRGLCRRQRRFDVTGDSGHDSPTCASDLAFFAALVQQNGRRCVLVGYSVSWLARRRGLEHSSTSGL